MMAGDLVTIVLFVTIGCIALVSGVFHLQDKGKINEEVDSE